MTPVLQIRKLLSLGATDSAAIDRFVADNACPIIEGTTATFLHRGHADAVFLRHWVYGLPSRQPFSRVADTDLWFLMLELPEKSRVEYKIEVKKGDKHHLIRDALNPNLAHDPFGANSVCQMTGYEIPEWSHHDDEARPGTIESHTIHSTAFGDDRTIEVYVPARMRPTRRYPLLVVHDGPDYLRYASLKSILDNLIDRQEIPRIIVALTQSPDRLHEYAADERHGKFIVEDVVPFLESTFPLRPGPNDRGLMGASFGGVAALATAWQHPGQFGRLLLQSGSFAFTDIGDQHERGPAFDPVVQFMNRFRDDPGQPAERLFISCGMHESLIYENRSLVPLLQTNGLQVRYVEARDGHNWENWRDRLREGLAWLFPGPLWMVYE